MRAVLKYHRQSPRKVRIVADLIRGKSVVKAREILEYTPKKATGTLSKMLDSAVANAVQNNDKNEKNLYIKKITVDKGFTMKRFIPKWRGTADPIRKFTSNIVIELAELNDKPETPSTKSETNSNNQKTKV